MLNRIEAWRICRMSCNSLVMIFEGCADRFGNVIKKRIMNSRSNISSSIEYPEPCVLMY